MLHNLFHSLPCIHSRIQIPSLCRYDPHHNICGTTILWIFSACFICFWTNTHSPSFLLLYLAFLTSSLQCLHTFLVLVTKVHFVGVSHFWPRGPLFFLLLPVYLLSFLHFFFLYSIHQPIIDIYGFAIFFFPFSDTQNSLTLIAFFFWTVTFADIASIFKRLNNVLPSFFFVSWTVSLPFILLVSSASSASLFWRSHTLLAFFYFFCLLIDVNPPSFP